MAEHRRSEITSDTSDSPVAWPGGEACQPPLYSDCAMDPDMADLVEMFVDEMPRRVAAIQRAVHDTDLAAIETLAHQLKGAAGGYGFGSITLAAAEVENRIRAGQGLGGLKDAIGELVSLCCRVSSRRPA